MELYHASPAAGLTEQDSPRARYAREKYPESWALALKEKRRTYK